MRVILGRCFFMVKIMQLFSTDFYVFDTLMQSVTFTECHCERRLHALSDAHPQGLATVH